MIEESDWRAECDARALAEAEVIKSDKERYIKAQRAASKLLKEKQKDISGFAKIAKSDKSHCRYDNPATVGKL